MPNGTHLRFSAHPISNGLRSINYSTAIHVFHWPQQPRQDTGTVDMLKVNTVLFDIGSPR
jgi:hypothetical protein